MKNNLIKKKDCSHKIIKEKLTKKSRAYFYCYKCGKLIIVKDLNIYEALNKGKLEFNPVKVINQMLIRQKEEQILINDKFKNNNQVYDINSNFYIKNRDTFILYLKQLCNKMNFSDNTFYHCLYLLDAYLIYVIKKEISKRTIFLITLGFFLISSKFNEKDIFEPNINQFCKIEKDIIVSQKEILNMEIKCLHLINYNMLNYSTYDWLQVFNKIGFIFNIDTINFTIEDIFEKQKYLLKRILNTDILYKYNSFQNAISIIHISMDNIFSAHKINKDLFELFLSIFNYKFSDYESCYMDMKNNIFNNYNKNVIENNKTENSNNGQNTEKDKNQNDSNKKKLNICHNKSVENILKYPLHLSNNNNNINKLQQKKIIIYLKDKFYKSKSEKIINILMNTNEKSNNTENEKNKITNSIQNFKEKKEFQLNDLTNISPKNKILFKKGKQHLTIDCNNTETIKNNKSEYEYNYSNIINYFFNKTKKNNSYRDIFSTNNFINNKNSSRNNVYFNSSNNNNDIQSIISEGNILNKNKFKKSLTSQNNSPFKNKQNIKDNKFKLLYNLSNYKNKSLLKMLNIDKINLKNNNDNEKINDSIQTFYNKNPIKALILNKNIFSSTSKKDWKTQKNIFLRNNNNNFINSKNNKNIRINKEIISSYINN